MSAVDNPFESLIAFGQISQAALTAAGGGLESNNLESNVLEIKQGLQQFFLNESFRRVGLNAQPVTWSNIGRPFPGSGLTVIPVFVRWICVRVYAVPEVATDLMAINTLHPVSPIPIDYGNPLLMMSLHEVGTRHYQVNSMVGGGVLVLHLVDADHNILTADQPGVFATVVGDGPIPKSQNLQPNQPNTFVTIPEELLGPGGLPDLFDPASNP